MLKWLFYSSNVLWHWFGSKAESNDFAQAILQHYGWRSFYLDATTSPAIAAWFASHCFTKVDHWEVCEDCDEVGVFLRKSRASYRYEDGTGHLYVIDIERVPEPIKVIDLSEIHIKDRRPRFTAQSACLLGPLDNRPLPQEFYRSHIIADRAIFREFSAANAITSTETLSPTRKDDPVLNSLLNLPWVAFGMPKEGERRLPLFQRTIDIPEYDDSFRKIQLGNVAFYQNTRIADAGVLVDGVSAENIVIPVSETAFFGFTESERRFPKIQNLVQRCRCVSFEINQLIQHVRFEHTAIYGKGVTIAQRDDDFVEVGELMVEHPGLRLTRAGMNAGWHYKINSDGIWERHQHKDDCPCGNEHVHLKHLSALTIIETQLADLD